MSLSRRAARAQREAEQTGQFQAPPQAPFRPQPAARHNEPWPPQARENAAPQQAQPWPGGPEQSPPWRPQQPASARPPQPPQPPQSRQRSARQAPSVLTGHPSTALRGRDRAPRTDEAPPGPDQAPPGKAAKPAKPVKPGRRLHVAAWLILASLLLALWSATTFIDSGNFLVATLASLSPLVTVLALPVIAVGVGSKHVVPTAIAVAAALLPWGFVAGYAAAGPGRATVGTGSTLRVMSVDGAHGTADALNIVQVARVYSVDVVVVTQLSNELAHQLTVDGLNVLGSVQWATVPADGVNGTGVWSGPQIMNQQPIEDLSQPGMTGQIEAGANGVGITVVQLTGDPLTRSRSWHSDLVKLANRRSTTQPGFIVGNLNATPWQPAFRKLTGAGWRDAADVVGQGLRPTWPTWSPLPLVPLDHLMVSPGLGVSSTSTTTIAGSNHRALIVTLVLPHAGG